MKTLKETSLDQCSSPWGFKSWACRPAPPASLLSLTVPALQPLSHPSHLQGCSPSCLLRNPHTTFSLHSPGPCQPPFSPQTTNMLPQLMDDSLWNLRQKLSSCLQWYWQHNVTWGMTKFTASVGYRKLWLRITACFGIVNIRHYTFKCLHTNSSCFSYCLIKTGLVGFFLQQGHSVIGSPTINLFSLFISSELPSHEAHPHRGWPHYSIYY